MSDRVQCLLSSAARRLVFANDFQWVCTWSEVASLAVSMTYKVGGAREL